MADRITATDAAPDASLTNLLKGIVGDLQLLIRQEMHLARTEVKQEWDKAKTAAGALAVGAAMLVLAVFMLCFMVVYLINWAGVPLWGSFAIVAGALGLIGLLLTGMGFAKARQVHLVPPQTAQTLKENVQWMQSPK